LATSSVLSLQEARLVALAAQDLASPRPSPAREAAAPAPRRRTAGVTRDAAETIARQVDRLGVLQLDAVNVLARAHYVPLFSRLGAYDRGAFDQATWPVVSRPPVAARAPERSLFEYWGHEASLLPVALQPLFRWRMDRAERLEGLWARVARLVREKRGYVDDVLSQVRERGPLGASDVASPPTRRAGSWSWGWSDAKTALEWLFWAGKVTTASRVNFKRLYDVPERVLPERVLRAPTPSVEDAHRELLRISARALGIATEDDLADYYRLRIGAARPRIAELIEEGSLRRVTVEAIDRPMFLYAGRDDAGAPARATGQALLSPFDPLVWYRPRSERLFGFHYRIEIYTPEHLRKHGYYVLPFLLGDRLAARVDLKADRGASVLRVPAAHLEPPASKVEVAEALARELRLAADWLGLARVEVGRRGSLARDLSAALRGRELRDR